MSMQMIDVYLPRPLISITRVSIWPRRPRQAARRTKEIRINGWRPIERGWTQRVWTETRQWSAMQLLSAGMHRLARK